MDNGNGEEPHPSRIFFQVGLKRWDRLRPFLPPIGQTRDVDAGSDAFFHRVHTPVHDAQGIEPNEGLDTLAHEELNQPITPGPRGKISALRAL